jgi:hypothetical protein
MIGAATRFRPLTREAEEVSGGTGGGPTMSNGSAITPVTRRPQQQPEIAAVTLFANLYIAGQSDAPAAYPQNES